MAGSFGTALLLNVLQGTGPSMLGSHKQMLHQHQETDHLEGVCFHGAASLSMKS